MEMGKRKQKRWVGQGEVRLGKEKARKEREKRKKNELQLKLQTNHKNTRKSLKT